MIFPALKTISLKQKIFFSVFVFFLFLFVLSFFVIFPAFQNMSIISAETKMTKQDLDMRMSSVADYENSIKNYQTVKSQIYLLDDFFINEEESINFVDSLENIADNNNVLQNASLLTENKEIKNFYSIIPIQISVSGSLEDLLSYLKDLENLDYYINIKKLEIMENSMKNISNKNILESISSGKNLVITADTFWIN